MVAVAEETADLRERLAGVLAQEVHGDVASGRDAFAPARPAESLARDVVVGADGVDDVVGLGRRGESTAPDRT